MSFNIANSGLNAVTEQMNSISNNIANSGTVGYKSSRAEFSSIYAQSQPLGVSVSGVTQSITRGGDITAGTNPLDLAISGNGFFVVHDSSGATSYTRAGYFGFDKEGYIVNNTGMKIQGFPVDGSGNLQVGTVSDLQISTGSIPAKATDSLNFTANFDAQAKEPVKSPFDPADKDSYNHSYTTQVFDSLGREHTMTQYIVKTNENEWQVHYSVDGTSVGSPVDIKFDQNGAMLEPLGNVMVDCPIAGAQDLNIAVNYGGSSQYGSGFSVSNNSSSGYASAERTGVQVDKDGTIYATYSNGERMLQGQLVLANFTNPNGLSPSNGTSWTQTSASGNPVLGTPGSGLLGAVQSYALEGSNVNLTAELVNLMTAQRNYQANTKVISTNDSMMQSLFQAL
ncbi:flagellar hook protein FlgE [Pragia fontium]|uniref:Flagellar hook protein FlgE n=2 Tax=Pragia fontium TaxID=82985 RepID=A0AAJ5BFR7_9GAMM|nr:flagellar hook protein FlgE [Pragia fontium]AKJ41386.1 flagellar hook protein FlgE [Pragia fontium]SFC01580.1 flagellar hook protein FlgE [Pragia fontium DSM 5563 = ATCC 49100]SUB81635.1 Flagellar hook protein flgE [Pragia fontium]VEJ54108.1 Flagellar hook protein flgE [Pragia fontium]GKX62942.1 flagellar hook protein FlgE [Pragia fontium]